MKRRITNTEIADYVFEKLNEKDFDVEYNKILEDIDISIDNDINEETDDYGYVREMTEEEIQEMKDNFFQGFLEEYENI